MYGNLFANVPKSNFKTREDDIKLSMPKESKDNMKTNIQSPTLNYILSEEYKEKLKDIQNSFTNYPSPAGLKYDWSLQQFSQPEILSNYTPLFLGKTKLIPSSNPVAHISTVSWPTDTKSDISALLPAKYIISSDMTTSNNLLGMIIITRFIASQWIKSYNLLT